MCDIVHVYMLTFVICHLATLFARLELGSTVSLQSSVTQHCRAQSQQFCGNFDSEVSYNIAILLMGLALQYLVMQIVLQDILGLCSSMVTLGQHCFKCDKIYEGVFLAFL